MSDQNQGIFARIMKTLSDIEANELKATFSAFSFAFILMCAYYLLRPVRDAMASDWTDTEVAFLWTINFFISFGLVALYGIAVSKFKFKNLVPGVYCFFGLSFILFYFTANTLEDRVLVDKCFYVWVSVFALFNLSVFWSCMSDTFNKNQAARLFAIITSGASLGAVVGPLLSALLVKTTDVDSMILVSAFMLFIPIPLITYLRKLKETELGNKELHIDIEKAKIGGNPFKGFADFFTNPYLLMIGVFIILYTGIGSFVYLEQKNLLEPFDIETRTVIYSYRDAAVNTITYLLAFFVTGRIVTRLGMSTALTLVPICLIFGMLILAFSPVLMAAVGMHIALRAGNYGLTRPSREMLFTEVDREARFKAKPVIDIVVYRGGDVIMGWFFAGLTDVIGLGLGAVAAVGAVIAAIWSFVGLLLGKRYNSKAGDKPLAEAMTETS